MTIKYTDRVSEKVDSDDFPLYLIQLDVVGIGLVTFEVCGETPNDAINEAINTITHIKHNDCGVVSVAKQYDLE